MREVISLHFGQSGVQLANTCWELFCLEHEIQPDGTIPNDKILEGLNSHLDSLFTQSQNGKYVPRAMLFDDDTLTLDAVKNSPNRTLFNPSNLHFCKDESGGLWARSYKTSENTEDIVTKITRLLEACDGISGIMIYHSIDGGFGGGFTSKLLETLKDDISKVTKATISILPSRFSYSNVAPYNSILTLSRLKELTDFNVLIDNNALYQVSQKQLDIDYPNFPIVNRMIAQMASSMTQSSRFSGSKFVDLIEMRMNLIPQPDLQFLHGSYAPFINFDKQNTELINLSQIASSLFDERSSFITCDHRLNQYIASTLFFRGDCPQKDIASALNDIKSSSTIKFVDWAPVNYQFAVSHKGPVAFPQSEQGKSNKAVCMIANSTALQEPLQDLLKNVNGIYQKRRYVHWFVGGGLEEGEIAESIEFLQANIKAYEEAGKESEKENKDETKKDGEDEGEAAGGGEGIQQQ